jgi:hypothetical protein
MQIDLEYLRRHYASLSDEGLLAIDETDLVDDARRIYDEELAARGLTPQAIQDDDPGIEAPPEAEDEGLDAGPDDDLDGGPEPDWLGDAAVAASFVSRPGGDTAQDAVEARDALEAAGIPCYLSTGKVEPQRVSAQQYELRLMVPGKHNLEAESVLDQKIFNREVEGQWKTHFQMLSDEELRAVDPEVLFGGLRDRIERVTRAYREELAQRKLE